MAITTTQPGAPVLPPPSGPRVGMTDPTPTWRIEWRGRVWREADLKGAHMAFVALLNGTDDWQTFDLSDLNPAVGPVRTMYLIAAFLAVDAGIDAADPERLTQIVREVGEASATELLASVHFG